ncbi:Uma2 family endonuclease [Actinocrinis puniceicyclus]|uniref:Uma2 family endonuclease n=1 Tax=Actinocrinis puniceicyclus TaxID=977794 RepID=A0A8J7WVR2_9ACTN|nr:Uma2 family endonuclease [Actinocrinis puniceicyclus]MBS2966064.1 Uma2 family endonuclease [Actinocrinis puniceicyclus]
MTTITMHPATLSRRPHRDAGRSADRRRDVGVPAIAHYTLPGRAYDLWVEGRLLEALGIPDDKRTRVEIVGGEIFVSPGPLFHHVKIATQIQKAFNRSENSNPEFLWQAVQGMDFDLRHVGDGYIPDLIVMSNEEYDDPANESARNLVAEQIAMVVEITSRSTATNDRVPAADAEHRTKWNGYAHEGVPFYLLVDRAPSVARVSLFTDPYLPDGVYQTEKHWAFGETIVLPEPFRVEIPTDVWRPWQK